MRRLSNEPTRCVLPDGERQTWDGRPHHELVALLDMLDDAIRDDSMMRIFYALEQLSNKTQERFSEEERQMRRCHYPDLMEHTSQHRSFTNLLYGLRRIYRDRSLTHGCIQELRDHLTQHLRQSHDACANWHGEEGSHVTFAATTAWPLPEAPNEVRS